MFKSISYPLSLALFMMASTVSAQDLSGRKIAQDSFDILSKKQHSAVAQWMLGQPGPSLITGLSLSVSGATIEDKAIAFSKAHGKLLGIEAADLKILSTQKAAGRVAVLMQQYHGDLEVFERQLTLVFDTAGKLLTVNNSTLPIGVVTPSRISPAQATRIGQALFGAKEKSPSASGKAQRVLLAQSSFAVEAMLTTVFRKNALDIVNVVVALSDGSIRGVHPVSKN